MAQSGSALGWGPSGRRFESGRPDSSGRLEWRSEWWRLDLLDTLYLLMGVIGFFAVIAVFFFGGFLLLDFIFARSSGGDA